MAYKTFQVKIIGIAPLIMHNSQLADPLNKFTRAMKAITAKGKKKTEADMEELARLEFVGGLYVDSQGRPAVPGEVIEGAIRDGARKSRQGKDSQCGVISDGLWPLIYDGPKKPDDLFVDERFRDYRGVRVNNSRIMRTRPKFPVWSLVFEVAFQDEITSKANVEKWLTDAGQFVGIMDYRPRFGRFEVEV